MPAQRDSRWQFNYFRMYDSITGRHLEADPIGQAGGLNLYAYVANLPLRFADPRGLFDPYQLPLTAGIASHGSPYHYAREERSWGQREFPGPENSPLRHCVVSCMVASVYGRGIGLAAGIVNEIQGLLVHDLPDLPARLRGVRPWAFQIEDFGANEVGFDCSNAADCGPVPKHELRDRCLECCRRAL